MSDNEWVSDDEGGGKTWGDTAKGALQTADDFVRAAANAVTFGGADRLAGYMGSGDRGYSAGVDEEVKRSAAARERSPYASVAGDVAGSVAIPGFGAEALAARMGGGALARGGAYGLTGAGTGAAQGAGSTYSENLPDYVKGATLGGAFGAPLGAVGGAIFGRRPAVTRAETPTIPELRDYKNTAYDVLNSNPARYDAQHLAQSARDLENRFATTVDRYHERDAPSTFRALDEMQQPYAAAVRAGPASIATVDPGNLEFIRQGINKIPPSAERAVDKSGGRHVKRALDEFVENPPVGAIMPGSEAAASEAAAQSVLARESHSGYKRALISDALRRNAEGQAQSTYSGLNLENELRKQYRSLLAIDKKTGLSGAQKAGFDADEIARMEQFRSGADTPGRNLLRWGAKTAGGGSGIGFLAAGAAGGGAGAYASDDPRWYGAAALPVAGLALRGAGNRLAMRNMQQIDELLRQRNPLYQERLATSGMQPGAGRPAAAKAMRDAIATEVIKQRQPTRVMIDTPSNEWE